MKADPARAAYDDYLRHRKSSERDVDGRSFQPIRESFVDVRDRLNALAELLGAACCELSELRVALRRETAAAERPRPLRDRER
jgi:hypothetical protein